MKKSLLVLAIIAFVLSMNNPLHAQKWKKNRKYITLHLGGTNFLGDLGGSKDIGTYGLKDFDIQSTRALFGIGYSYRLKERFNTKANLYFGWIGGDDAWTAQPNRNSRNLNFRSILFEVSTQAELYLTVQNVGQSWGRRRTNRMPFSSYLFAGIGGIYFNPQGKYTDGKWYDLQPLNTEGQGLVETRKPYSRFALSVPFGIGIKYDINKKYSFGFEYGMRWTNTDYMDDVSTTYFDPAAIKTAYGEKAAYFSNPADIDITDTYGAYSTRAGTQRGNPVNNDSYMFATVTLYVNLHRTRVNVVSFQY